MYDNTEHGWNPLHMCLFIVSQRLPKTVICSLRCKNGGCAGQFLGPCFGVCYCHGVCILS